MITFVCQDFYKYRKCHWLHLAHKAGQ